jgi:DNA-binding transcriptional LysR family regulator
MTPPTPFPLSVELRLLRYAIAVADELHFTRASIRLHVATPSLSRQIRQLEQVLGYTLFERKTRTVSLTAAGAAFVAEARRALVHAQRAVEAGAAVSAGERRVVRVGYTPLLDAVSLCQVHRHFVESTNENTLFFQSTYSIAQVEQILDGRLHAGLVVLPIAARGLQTDSLIRQPLVAAVPEHSALAQCPVLYPEDIAQQPFVWFGKLTNPHLYKHFMECCASMGFTPKVIHEVSTVMEILDLVAGGVGISFVQRTVQSRFHPEGIAFREFAVPELALEIGVTYRDGDRSEGLLTLLRTLKQLRPDQCCNAQSPVESAG